MQLQTIVDISPSQWKISYDDSILLLGSCFADSMGEQMKQRALSVTSNPFGTLYNPISIAQAVNYRLPFTSQPLPLVEHEGLWHSMAHHGSFSRPTREEAEQAVRESVETMLQALNQASVVIVTFGTAWVYEMVVPSGNETEKDKWIVGNCHKLPETNFTRRRLTVDEIIAAWQPVLERYREKHWIFTVSPIRHQKDGLHENQLSKATLLLAVERLVHLQSLDTNIHYFPSYEILLDELRDYRFYADDMLHPSSLAVQYIWKRFIDCYCTPQTINEMQIRLKQWKQTQHRPLH